MRLLLTITAVLLTVRALAAAPGQPTLKPHRITAADLDARVARLHGQGRVPGLIFGSWGSNATRIAFSDDSAFARPEFDASGWAKAERMDSLDALDSAICWVRFAFEMDRSLDLDVLELRLSTAGRATVWLDGRQLMDHTVPPVAGSLFERPGSDSTALYSIPLPLSLETTTHILALRLESRPPGPPPFRVLRASLHRPAATARMHRSAVHLAVFLAVNLFILVMALLFWNMDKHDRVWPWFAALTATNAIIAFANLAQTLDLGLGSGTLVLLEHLTDALFVAPLCLSVLLLVILLGQATRKLWRLYLLSAIVLNGVAIAVVVFGARYDGKDAVVMVAVVLAGALLAVVPACWFLIETVRLSWRVMRSKGFQKWIGAGILLGNLIPITLQVMWGLFAVITDRERSVLSEGIQTSADYIAYIAIPLCIIIALAIRTSHQNRLLARQRDDLDKEVHERTAELRLERDRSENLLLNILPQEVADELKQTGSAEARHFDLATVLFSDFKGFTEMSGTMPPAELLQELNACFRAFDDIIGKRGIEKIKTIGDAYMCAGGLPDPKNADPVAVVMAALEMQEFMQQRERQRSQAGLFAFQMRLGIHSGPVVAGIVGVKKFQYDIWGDTVNMASRMETNGETGRVNISASTFELVKDQPGLAFHPRGTVVVKGKGATEMWFVERA